MTAPMPSPTSKRGQAYSPKRPLTPQKGALEMARPAKVNHTRKDLKHINYDYQNIANQDTVFFRSRDKTWPRTILTQRRIAATDPLTLWWRIRVQKRGVDARIPPSGGGGSVTRANQPFKLRTIRSWASRRARNVMLQALREHGLDECGRAVDNADRVDVFGGAAGAAAVSLVGTLVIYVRESILTARREEVLADVRAMLARIKQDVGLRRVQGKVYARTHHSPASYNRLPLAAWVDAKDGVSRGGSGVRR